MRILAFDVGTKKIGVAVGQTISKTAEPLERIMTQQGEADWSAIAAYYKEWQPKAFVVGIPTNIDGSDMNMTDIAKQFLLSLQAHYPQHDIYEVDERLTTQEAKQIIFDRYGYKGLKSKDIDGLAACLMLEQWMQNHVD